MGGALFLALIAAVLFGLGAVLQQRAARASARLVITPRRQGRRLANLLLGSPTWLAGAAVELVGFGFHASALHLGSLAVVQPILMLTLPVSLMLGLRRGRRLAQVEWAGIGLVCGAVVLFLAASAPQNGPPRSRWLLALVTVVCFATVAGLYALGRGATPAWRGGLIGAAAALAMALTAALTKAATADLASGGIAGPLTHWPLYALVVAAALGVGLEQVAFAGAPLAAVMLPVTVLNPVAAAVIGMVGWHEQLATTGPVLAIVILIALVAASVGVGILSRSPLVQPPRPRVK